MGQGPKLYAALPEVAMSCKRATENFHVLSELWLENVEEQKFSRRCEANLLALDVSRLKSLLAKPPTDRRQDKNYFRS